MRPRSRCFFRTTLPLLAGLLPFLLLSEQALAHSVHIFAWADGERICTESYFTKTSRVRDGEAVMADTLGRILASGRTDETGLACFPLPDKAQDLTFSILAGQGHRGEFLLRAVDMAASFPQAPASPDSSPSPAAPEADVFRSEDPLEETDPQDGLRTLVRQELQRQLAPILQTLAEMKEDRTPGAREIIGGIGWILGLAALGQWFAARRKRPGRDDTKEKV
jgi:nickel transport protein